MWRILIEHVPIEHVQYKVFTFQWDLCYDIEFCVQCHFYIG